MLKESISINSKIQIRIFPWRIKIGTLSIGVIEDVNSINVQIECLIKSVSYCYVLPGVIVYTLYNIFKKTQSFLRSVLKK